MTGPACVLDASAFLCYLQGESGSDRVTEALVQGCAMSSVNWAEALSKLADRGVDPDLAALELADQGVLGSALLIHPLDEALARGIARFRPLTRAAGLALGDRACLALAQHLGLPALTADRNWLKLGVGVKIESIR